MVKSEGKDELERMKVLDPDVRELYKFIVRKQECKFHKDKMMESLKGNSL